MHANHDAGGLSHAEAAERLRHDGRNELPRARSRTLLHITREVVAEPMFRLLVLAGLVYLFVGELAEALMLLCFVQISILITVIQERRSEKALEALRELASPRALVIRDGRQHSIDSREVVRGDLLVLIEGDRVAADAMLLSSHNLLVDESLLTGESLAVVKRAGEALAQGRVSSGTMVVSGHGVARVIATGPSTDIGKIGLSLHTIKSEPTRLHSQTKRFVRIFGLIGLGLSLLTTLVMGALQGEWLQGLLSGITLAMSVLPEEFAVVSTVFIAMGAWRISRHQVLTRRNAAIETLGSATVLCTDKTGTLTENQMSVVGIWTENGTWRPGDDPPAALSLELLELAALASKPDASDPMEQAIHALASHHVAVRQCDRGWVLERAYPLSAQMLAVTHVWKNSSGSRVIASKGALEAILGLCALPADQAQGIRHAADDFARQGMRVLGVARGCADATAHLADPPGLQLEFVGLLALADPLRASVPDAVRDCQQAGIRVVMITGDYPVTALAIAKQAGITVASDGPEVVMTGDELLQLSESELDERARVAKVYARVRPEQKLRIVQALKAGGDIVAMTGDGVNDAPALKAADIGIAMGRRGTDVARESAALVLLQDDFASIVKAIEQGRRIYANLKKALAYIIAIHIPIAGLAMLPLVFGAPMLFFPAHIAFLELIIDPTSCFVFESQPGHRALMRSPPRSRDETLFSRDLFVASVSTGLALLLVLAVLYLVLQQQGFSQQEIRTVCFATLVMGGVLIALVSLAGSRIGGLIQTVRNQAFWWMTSAATVMLLIVFVVPFIRDLFKFVPASMAMLPWLGAALMSSFLLMIISTSLLNRQR